MPDSPASALLEVSGVAFAYPGAAPTLRDITLTVERGMVLGLVGSNGAGKSTLGRVCAGVLPPKEGRVLVAGAALAGLSPQERIRAVRVCFQYPEHELFRPSLGAELDWEAGRLGRAAGDLRQRALTSLTLCGIPHALDAHPYDLDPWSRKVGAIVAALAVPGRLVILDEPTIRLAQRTKGHLADLLIEYVTTGGSVVVISHDYEFCHAACGRVARMAAGRIERVGDADDVLTGDAMRTHATIFSFPSHYLAAAVQRRRGQPR